MSNQDMGGPVYKRLPDGSVFVDRKALLASPRVRKQIEAARKLAERAKRQEGGDE